MRKILFTYFLVFVFNALFAQDRKIDSLFNIIKLNKRDSTEVEAREKLSRRLISIGPDTAISMANTALALAVELNMKRAIGAIYSKMGYYYGLKGDYSRVSFYHFKALGIFEELERQAAPEKKEFFQNAISNELNGIGTSYEDLGDKPRALEYYMRAAAIDEKNKDTLDLAGKYNNIGGVYYAMKQGDKAMDYFNKALQMNIAIGNEAWKAVNLMNIANILMDRRQFDTALVYYYRSLAINEKLDKKWQIALNLGNIGSVYFKKRDYIKTEEYFKKAHAISTELGDLPGLEFISKNLYELYRAQGRYELALKYFEDYRQLRDSLVNEEKNEEILRNEMTYEFDIKQAKVKAEQDKKDALAATDQRKQKLTTILVSSGLILLFILIAFMLRSLLITRRQKKVIELRNAETQKQKEVIESQHHDILDSIHYARRIQQSLLPTEKYITKQLSKRI